MKLITQPFNGQIGNEIIRLLESPDFQSLTFVVAFAKNSGVLRLKDPFECFRKRGGKVNAYVGIDLKGSSYEALTTLLLMTDSLSVVHFDGGQTFHPKIYQFNGKDRETLIIGSSNLTEGGLWTNCESSIVLSVNKSDEKHSSILQEMGTYIATINALKDSRRVITNQNDIEELRQKAYVDKEAALSVRRKKVLQGGQPSGLFGKGISARLPQLSKESQDESDPSLIPSSIHNAAHPTSNTTRNEGQTLWIETRSMTGGSSNILDLSMRSRLERGCVQGTAFDSGDPNFMRGTVEFFGIEPSDTDRQKNLTLNFEGVDYIGNTILFPRGKKANGTWRLQIKGTDPSGKKITDIFVAKGKKGYLKNKIITFTKVDADDSCYRMEVFSDEMLSKFRDDSSILARNGNSMRARQIGVL